MNYSSILEVINNNNDNIILLLPIGPPGSGKTSLKEYLIEKIKDRIIISPSRDIIFKKYRENNGIKKSRHLTHKEMISMVTNVKSNTKYLIYIDSTNSNCGIREIYLSAINPNKIIYICFHTNHLKDPINYLLKRTLDRKHPTFPIEKSDKIRTIKNILTSIDYPIKDNINIFI